MSGNKKISQLVDGGAGQAGDDFVIERGGVNFKVDNSSVSGNPGGLLLSGVVNDMIVKDEKAEVALEQRITLPAVKSFVDNTAAPPTEVDGDIYLLDNTGASHASWDGLAANTWARFDGTAGLWKGITAVNGFIATEIDTGVVRYFDPTSSTWEILGQDNPAGANTEIQYNNAGVFGASSLFTFDGTTFSCDAAAVFNEGGTDQDFRIEGLTAANLFFVDAGNDRIGINTNTPGYRIQINSTSNWFDLYHPNKTVSFGCVLSFSANDSGDAESQYAALQSVILTNTAGSERGALAVQVAHSGGVSEVARFISSSTGKKLGINTTGPSATLDVAGFDTGTVNFNFRAGGSGASANTLVCWNNKRVSVGYSANPPTTLALQEDETIAASQTDEYSAGLTLDPEYSANSASSFTIDRHNYIDVNNVVAVNDGAGTLTVTDACVMRFDAAAGTHSAIDAGTTKSTPGTVDAWRKDNINGTVYYTPMYTSKTT